MVRSLPLLSIKALNYILATFNYSMCFNYSITYTILRSFVGLCVCAST